MRVSTVGLSDRILRGLFQNTEQLFKLNEKLGTGKKINRSSDDPVGYLRASRIKTELNRNKQFQRNIDVSNRALSGMEENIKNQQDLLRRVRKLVIQGGTDTVTQSDRVSISEEINQILEEALSLGNSQVDGRSIFAGGESLKKAFSGTRNGIGELTSVAYDGNRVNRSLSIDESNKVKVSLTGDKIFQAVSQTLTGGSQSFNGTSPGLPFSGDVTGTGVSAGYADTEIIKSMVPSSGQTSGSFLINGKTITYDLDGVKTTGKGVSLLDLTQSINNANADVTAAVAGSAQSLASISATTDALSTVNSQYSHVNSLSGGSTLPAATPPLRPTSSGAGFISTLSVPTTALRTAGVDVQAVSGSDVLFSNGSDFTATGVTAGDRIDLVNPNDQTIHTFVVKNVIDRHRIQLDSTLNFDAGQQTSVVSGSDGQAAAGGVAFTSASSTFLTKSVKPGDFLRLSSGTDQGIYRIATVDSENQVTLDRAITSALSGASFTVERPPFSQSAATFDAHASLSANTDMATTAGSDIITSAAAAFVTKGVSAGDVLEIMTANGVSRQVVKSVINETQLQLESPLSFTSAGVQYSVLQASSQSLRPGTFTLNGVTLRVDSDSSGKVADSLSSLVDKINAVSNTTHVKASISSSNQLVLDGGFSIDDTSLGNLNTNVMRFLGVTSGAATKNIGGNLVAKVTSNYQLSLTGNESRQIFASDQNNTSLLADLKLIDPSKSAPNNISSSASGKNGSIYDVLIKIRDDLRAGHGSDLRGTDLADLSSAQDNMSNIRAEIGSSVNRVDRVQGRLDNLDVASKDLLSKIEDADLTKVATELSIQRTNQQTTLRASSQILQLSLVNFLR